MSAPSIEARTLRASTGDFPLAEYRLRLAGREWSILHTGALLTNAAEADFFQEFQDRLPYGAALWPAAIALANEVASRADAFHDRTVLELGAGTGMPGIVAASMGARVTQTDRQQMAMSICQCNGEQNGVRGIEYRLVDWAAWDDPARYQWIIGSDILYSEAMHPHLKRIFENNLAPGGRILVSDPFRAATFQMLEQLEADGWRVSCNHWSVGEESSPRPAGVFELVPPGAS